MLTPVAALSHEVEASSMKFYLDLSATIGMVFMTGEQGKDNRFGVIAVELNFVDQEKVDKALVVQSRIFEKTRVKMPIGEILTEMGAISVAERNEILQMQRDIDGKTESGKTPESPPKKSKPARSAKKEGNALDISVSKDKLTATAYIDGKVPVTEFDVNDVKIMLHAEGILHGIAEDARIKAFLNGDTSGGVGSTLFNFNCNADSPTAGVSLLQMQMLPSAAYRINKNHSIGASVAIAVQQFRAYGLQAFGAAGRLRS